MYIGACYYPEHWPRARWLVDLKMMKELGFNVIRVGDYVWSRCEPEEGNFRFDWLEEAVDLFGREGIRTVMCTPTSGIPRWIDRKHPDVRPVDKSGLPGNYGSRNTFCANHPGFREDIRRIVTEQVRRFKDNDHVILYQIDNELSCHGIQCFCENCRQAFIAWAQDHFGTVENYNDKLGLVVWANEVRQWDDIFLPRSGGGNNPGLSHEFRKFCSSSVIEFARFQYDIIKSIDPDVLVTTNFMGRMHSIDHFAMLDFLDLAAFDSYPIGSGGTTDHARHCDFMHSLKKGTKFWMLEQQTSPTAFRKINRPPEPGEAALYTWHSIARGACGITYFRWRCARFGAEQLGGGLIRHDGNHNRISNELKGMIAKVKELEPLLDKAERPRARVGILYSYPSVWAYESGKWIHDRLRAGPQIDEVYNTLHRNHVTVDFIRPGEDIASYELLVVPGALVITEEQAQWLEAFVNAGGKLIATALTGMYDEYHLVTDGYYQGRLRKLLGVRSNEWCALPEGSSSTVAFNDKCFTSELLDMVVETETAETLGTFADTFRQGQPAVTSNAFGQGAACYVGFVPNQEFYEELLRFMLPGIFDRGVQATAGDVQLVDIVVDGQPAVFVLNHSGKAEPIAVAEPHEDLISNRACSGEVPIEPYQVLLLRLSS